MLVCAESMKGSMASMDASIDIGATIQIFIQ